MIRPTVRDKLLPDALRQGLLQSVLVFALSAARVGGIYAPWALGGCRRLRREKPGVMGAAGRRCRRAGVFRFPDGAAVRRLAVLIYSANMAFCDTKMYARKGFAPLLAALALRWCSRCIWWAAAPLNGRWACRRPPWRRRWPADWTRAGKMAACICWWS